MWVPLDIANTIDRVASYPSEWNCSGKSHAQSSSPQIAAWSRTQRCSARIWFAGVPDHRPNSLANSAPARWSCCRSATWSAGEYSNDKPTPLMARRKRADRDGPEARCGAEQGQWRRRAASTAGRCERCESDMWALGTWLRLGWRISPLSLKLPLSSRDCHFPARAWSFHCYVAMPFTAGLGFPFGGSRSNGQPRYYRPLGDIWHRRE